MDKLYSSYRDDMNSKKRYVQENLSFLDLELNQEKKEIWAELGAGLWKDININYYLENKKLPPDLLHLQKPLFPRFYQIEPGLKFNNFTKSIELDLYYPKPVSTGFNALLNFADKYFHSLPSKKIGVHLSGGLDSSIIIGLLHELKIPFVAIGLQSHMYEFRTEAMIQNKLLEWCEDGCLISMEEYPFYSALEEVPKHQIPGGFFKSFAANRVLAKEFQKRGCDIVFTGQGGDSLFVDGFNELNQINFNIGDEFLNGEEDDLIYRPYGISLQSFYAIPEVIDLISNARIGQKDDSRKLWARKWLKKILIPELTSHCYVADYIGSTMWGLEQAKPNIRNIMEESYDFTKMAIFSPENINKFLSRDIYSFEYDDYIDFCSLLSLGVWFHSLLSYE